MASLSCLGIEIKILDRVHLENTFSFGIVHLSLVLLGHAPELLQLALKVHKLAGHACMILRVKGRRFDSVVSGHVILLDSSSIRCTYLVVKKLASCMVLLHLKLTVLEHLVKFFHATLVSIGKEFNNILN